ncbi:PepSY-associated TM helix domain-containing protein [Bradyrhizobium sp. AZCC 1610]|uniref:PepSY-associated TM helix domain-containing protein n=1 Tax=Bradyrhizobium sp. AZCC 1610 TaxID=3117020 RepID=UPI002FF027FB
MKARTVRIWSVVHTWSSLISTLFLLLLCVTGLPLIFHHEIDELLGYDPKPEIARPGAVKQSIDEIARTALAHDSGRVLQYILWDKDEPNTVIAFTNNKVDGDPDAATLRAYDAHTAKPLGSVGGGPMLIFLKLHVDMFAGQPGKLFLGAMGFLFLVAIISGVVLYWPFTRRLSFGTLRDKSRRIAWFDWHNLLGAITIAWALVVGATGVINTLAEIMLSQWKATELADMVKPYAGKPPPVHLASLDATLDKARKTAPDMNVSFAAFPGTPFTSSHHFAVFMRGDTPLTSRLLKPVLLDGETGEVSDARDLPVYLKALLVSQPLHFGDYGGMPLKIIWALLDIMTIVVIGSGLYLWIVKRRKHRSHAIVGQPSLQPSE